jgi:hypothetical protein
MAESRIPISALAATLGKVASRSSTLLNTTNQAGEPSPGADY